MDTVVIVIHLMVVVALIAVVLVQRSEGGALGIGRSNNFLTGRGSGNIFTRATGILGAVFFATSLLMTIITRMAAPPSSVLDTVPTAGAPVTPPAISDTVQPEPPPAAARAVSWTNSRHSPAARRRPRPRRRRRPPSRRRRSPRFPPTSRLMP